MIFDEGAAPTLREEKFPDRVKIWRSSSTYLVGATNAQKIMATDDKPPYFEPNIPAVSLQ
jgi:hypothetical protein